jgi:uncharacterized protein (TIGR02391 family)
MIRDFIGRSVRRLQYEQYEKYAECPGDRDNFGDRRQMTVSLHSMLPSATAVLALEPEELADVLLTHIQSLPPAERDQLNRYNFFLPHAPGVGPFAGYSPNDQDAVAPAFLEAWAWLEREGLLIPRRSDSSGLYFVLSRRATKMTDRGSVDAYRHQNLLPREQLHPRIAQKVWALFLRGDYDVAVFQAFKEVEVSVRSASGFGDDVFGVDLMRDAFNPNTGPLRDETVLASERVAMASLFAGAYGVFRNPQGHRHVPVTDPREAAEIITIASHLLRIVDARTPNV